MSPINKDLKIFKKSLDIEYTLYPIVEQAAKPAVKDKEFL
jgi:hypothetical protein